MTRGRSALARLFIALSLVSLSSCAWWEDHYFFSTKPKTAPSDLVPFPATLTVKPLWNASVGKAGRYFFSPAVIGPDVIAAGGKGVVERRVLATGLVVWRTDLDTPLSAGVGANGSTVAVVTASGDVLALNGDGKPRWRVPTGSEVLSAPAIGQGLVVVRTSDDRVIAFEEETGRKKWTFTRAAQPLVLRSNPGLVIEGQLVFAGFPGGKLIALTTASGVLRWESSVAVPKGTTELERVADVVGTPVVSGREICVGAFHGRVGCFDINSGNPVWTRDLSTSTGLVIDGRFGYVTDENANVIAISRTSGQQIWKNDKMAYRRMTAPASVGRAIVVGDYRGFVHWMSREDGSLIARTETDKTALTIAPISFSAGSQPAVLFQTPGGNLYAFVTD